MKVCRNKGKELSAGDEDCTGKLHGKGLRNERLDLNLYCCDELEIQRQMNARGQKRDFKYSKQTQISTQSSEDAHNIAHSPVPFARRKRLE